MYPYVQTKTPIKTDTTPTKHMHTSVVLTPTKTTEILHPSPVPTTIPAFPILRPVSVSLPQLPTLSSEATGNVESQLGLEFQSEGLHNHYAEVKENFKVGTGVQPVALAEVHTEVHPKALKFPKSLELLPKHSASIHSDFLNQQLNPLKSQPSKLNLESKATKEPTPHVSVSVSEMKSVTSSPNSDQRWWEDQAFEQEDVLHEDTNHTNTQRNEDKI